MNAFHILEVQRDSATIRSTSSDAARSDKQPARLDQRPEAQTPEATAQRIAFDAFGVEKIVDFRGGREKPLLALIQGVEENIPFLPGGGSWNPIQSKSLALNSQGLPTEIPLALPRVAIH